MLTKFPYFALLALSVLALVATAVYGGESQAPGLGIQDPFTPPEGAQQIGAMELQCGGILAMYDLNQNVEDGAEFILVLDPATGKAHAAVVYGPGADGGFLGAAVQRPGGAPETFTSPDALGAAYPNPCRAFEPVDKT